MTDLLNGADRWRERQRWLPAWLDDADWKSWCWHAAITVVLGQLAGWLFPGSGVVWMRFFVFVYFCREVANVYDRKRIRLPLKPLDHVMDVVAPLVACELVGWLA